MVDPFEYLFDKHPQVALHEHLPLRGDNRHACTNGRSILIRPGLSQKQRRFACAHEIQHIERDPKPTGPYQHYEERICDRAAARWLIPIRALLAAIAWTRNTWELCDLLCVTRHGLWTRLKNVTTKERHAIEAVIPPGECLAMTKPRHKDDDEDPHPDDEVHIVPENWGEECQLPVGDG